MQSTINSIMLLPFLLLACSHVVHATQIANDPPLYFGGFNHDDYLAWVASVDGKYDSSMFIPKATDQAKGIAIHWSIEGDDLHIAVAAAATGWVGFGISEAGGMLGSDMAIYVRGEPTEIIDAYVVEERFPQIDECQHWAYQGHFASGASARSRTRETPGREFLIFETSRKLDTGDPQDLKISMDNDELSPPTRVIGAWGDTDTYSFHGSNYARGSIRFLGDGEQTEAETFDETIESVSEGSFFIGATSYIIPSNTETTYANFCVTKSQIIDQIGTDPDTPLSIVGFRPVLPTGPSVGFVHHFVVTALSSDSDFACETENPLVIVYAWGPGFAPNVLPDNLGMPLFSEGGFNGFNIEIHYNNPTLVSGIIDSTGLKIYYSSEIRDIEVGVLVLGDPIVNLAGAPVGLGGLAKHTFDCPDTCSQVFLNEGESVTVFQETMHMHQSGTRMTNEQIRNGAVIRSSSVEVYDYSQSGNAIIRQEPYEIQYGDSFSTSCYYSSEGSQIFGFGSEDEMCISTLYYYPRKALPSFGTQFPWFCGFGVWFITADCVSPFTSEYNIGEEGLGRTFGTAGNSCGPTPAPVAGPTLGPTPAPTPGPTPSNDPTYLEVRIRNSSFERPGRWKILSGNPVRDCMSGSAYFRQCHYVFNGDASGTTHKIKYNVIDMPEGQPAGKSFKLKFWLAGESMPERKDFKAFLKMAGDNGIDFQSCRSTMLGSFEYQEMVCRFESSDPFDRMIILFQYTGTSGSAWLDRVRLYEAV